MAEARRSGFDRRCPDSDRYRASGTLLIGLENHMPLEKETLVVPKAFLHQIMDMLSQIAKPTSGLSSEKVAAVNDVRRQLITFFPMKLKSASRSTDGPSADDIFQKGFRLGAKAVMENFADCADAGISSSEAFRIVLKWLRRPRLTALTKF